MKTITALKAQKNPDRVSVFLDDEFAFGLYRVVAASLQVGQTLSEEKIGELKDTEDVEKAYQRAINYLSYRVRSESEVRKNLKKHDTPEVIIDEVLERLRRQHLVNDLAFAESWVDNRSTFRPRGRRALGYELRRKGVKRQVIDQVLEDLDEETLAYRAASKKYRRYRKLAWPEFRKKMLAYLSRRGFKYYDAAQAVEKVWNENQPEATSR